MICWLCYCWLDIWYWAKDRENQSMLKLSPAIMETSRPASLPSRCDSGQMRITELLTERISDTQRTHTTLPVLIPLISGFICVFLIPPFNCCSCLIRTPGRISASIISCFLLSLLDWSSLGGINLSVVPDVARVLAGVDLCVVNLWLSDVQGFYEPVSGTVLSALTHSSICQRNISDRSVQWSKAWCKTFILYSFRLR